MSNIKYIRNRATAERLIRNNGDKFQLKRETAGTFDPVTEETTDPVVETQDVIMVILPPKTGAIDGRYERFRGENGTLDFSVLKEYLMSTEKLLWRPQALEKVFLKGEWWNLETIQALDPDGATDIFYKGILRRV